MSARGVVMSHLLYSLEYQLIENNTFTDLVELVKKVDQALSKVDMQTKEAANQARLGFYNGDKFIGRNKHDLVNLSNEFSRSMGLEIPPAIQGESSPRCGWDIISRDCV